MLPSIVICEIMKHLPVRDLLILSGTCKRIYNIGKNQNIWEHLGKRDFNNLLCYDYDDFESERGWISCYIYSYQHCNICNLKYNEKVKKLRCVSCLSYVCNLCCKQSKDGMCVICMV